MGTWALNYDMLEHDPYLPHGRETHAFISFAAFQNFTTQPRQ